MSQPHKLCPRCSFPAALTEPACSKCGHVYSTVFATPQPTMLVRSGGGQSAAAAIMLSLILPGGGQMYNHQNGKCVLCFFAGPGLLLLGVLVLFLPVLMPHDLALYVLPLAMFAPVCWVLAPCMWFVQIIDAAMIAGRLNRGEHVRPWQWF